MKYIVSLASLILICFFSIQACKTLTKSEPNIQDEQVRVLDSSIKSVRLQIQTLYDTAMEQKDIASNCGYVVQTNPFITNAPVDQYTWAFVVDANRGELFKYQVAINDTQNLKVYNRVLVAPLESTVKDSFGVINLTEHQ